MIFLIFLLQQIVEQSKEIQFIVLTTLACVIVEVLNDFAFSSITIADATNIIYRIWTNNKIAPNFLQKSNDEFE